MLTKFRNRFQEREGLSPVMFIPLLVFILFFCLILVWSLSPVNAEGYIPAPLHASTQANYALEDDNLIPRIDHDNIEDIILDHNPFVAAEIKERMAELEESLQIPVPEKTLTTSADDAPPATPSPLPSPSPSPPPTAIEITPEPNPTIAETPSPAPTPVVVAAKSEKKEKKEKDPPPPPPPVESVPAGTKVDQDLVNLEVGSPDDKTQKVKKGEYVVVDVSGDPITVEGPSETNYDLVYYEDTKGDGKSVDLDRVIVGISKINTGNPYYEVFNWGDGEPNTNTNLDSCCKDGSTLDPVVDEAIPHKIIKKEDL